MDTSCAGEEGIESDMCAEKSWYFLRLAERVAHMYLQHDYAIQNKIDSKSKEIREIIESRIEEPFSLPPGTYLHCHPWYSEYSKKLLNQAEDEEYATDALNDMAEYGFGVIAPTKFEARRIFFEKLIGYLCVLSKFYGKILPGLNYEFNYLKLDRIGYAGTKLAEAAGGQVAHLAEQISQRDYSYSGGNAKREGSNRKKMLSIALLLEIIQEDPTQKRTQEKWAEKVLAKWKSKYGGKLPARRTVVTYISAEIPSQNLKTPR